MVNERLRRSCDNASNLVVAANKAFQFFPRWCFRSPEIKASNAVLLYCGNIGALVVPLSVVTQYNPTLRADLRQPFIIRRVVPEFELAPRIVMVFDGERRTSPPQRIRKTDSKITIKVEG
jgi:hypothetical protein